MSDNINFIGYYVIKVICMLEYWKVKKEPGIGKDSHWEDHLKSKRIQYLLSFHDEDIPPLHYNNDPFWYQL
jgi:hypothetical protein